MSDVCADIDECSSDYSPCHEQATCSNEVGSLSCDCNTGFTGNGFHCDGKWSEIIITIRITFMNSLYRY